jgi:hypothetical protein
LLPKINPPTSELATKLTALLTSRLDGASLARLEARCAALESPDEKAQAKALFLAFSLSQRLAGTAPLAASTAEQAMLQASRPRLELANWTCADAVRVLVLLRLPTKLPTDLRRILDELASSADIGELVALYRSLPCLPHPELHRERCAEGIRTNIRLVFAAIAHGNPYPAEQLEDAPWNQMVLKALFVGLSLHPIIGLTERANNELARMLHDYARERLAASRSLSPELWRPLVRCAQDSDLELFERALAGPDRLSARGLALALQSCTLASAAPLRDQAAALFPQDPKNPDTWSGLAAQLPA